MEDLNAVKIHILLIEDNQGDAVLIRENLKTADPTKFNVEHKKSLADGLAEIENGNYEIILLDLGLPDSQGLKTLHAVDKKAPDVPIVLLTGLDDEALALEAVGMGAQDYLVKGQVDSNLLARSIRYAVARKRSEMELMRLKTFNEGIIQSMGEGIVLQDPEGYLTFANPAASTLLGYSSDELIGKHWKEIIPPEQHEAVESADQRRFKGESDHYELEVVRKNQERIDVLVAGSPRFENGVYLGNMAVFTDITERKRLEKAEKELVKMKDKFISNVSHELRTPIFTINGFLSLLREGKVEDINAQREFLNRACYDADRLASLVDDLIDMSMFESGLLQLNSEKVDLNDLILKVSQTMNLIASAKDVTLSYDPSPVPIGILCDLSRMERTLGNLMETSIKASETGGLVQISGQMTNRNYIIRITDHGPPIPAEEQAEIFDIFSKADASTEVTRGGSGLGLYLSKLIVEAHGGEIKFESKVGMGNTFSISLPN
jgi:PAS domain S-box-containing protein